MKFLPAIFSSAVSFVAAVSISSAADAIPATSADGRVLNLGFEDGTLRDWTAVGDAFEKQPVKGEIDQTRLYGKGRVSNRKGEYWMGGYEVQLNDKGKGALTSVEFKVTQPWASFLVGGGALPGTRVEIVTKDDGKVIHTARGVNDERMAQSVVDLRKFEKREIFIRIVDEETAGWGHVNFDDFIFHAEEPKFPADQLAKKPGDKSDPNLKPDAIEYAGIPAEKAAQVATVPEGYELKVFAAEPDIVNPIAFCLDDRARVWVVEGMTYPQRAKTEPGAPEWLGGKDRILVFEDTDGDGHFDKRTVFMEGLNLVSGIEVGFGGVFVGAAPNLIFIPVENWDDPKPGKVEVLLNGWGGNDTHETLNTFHWGPDGWLYGCHGVFTHSLVGKPGAPMPGEAKNEPDENAIKQLRDELAAMEKEMQTGEEEMHAFQKQNNIGFLREDANAAARYVLKLNVQMDVAFKELEAPAPKQNIPAEKTRSDALRIQIENLKQTRDTWEAKALDLNQRIAGWDTIRAKIERTKVQMARVSSLAVPVKVEQKPAAPRVALNAGIWRYQPQRREFEVFAHGTSNPWGMDWNADGDLFAEACVIPHLFHIIQGARYQRQAGQHFDPHTYDDIKTIADHRHYLGATPHSGNGKSDTAGGGHAHAGLCIPQHPSWPDGIRGNVLMNNIHGARINMDVLERKGSGYVAHHGADFINFHDKASQIVDLREGPDGTLFMIDWYDLNQCHNPRREAHDYTTGRIFRLGRKGQIVKAVNLGQMETPALFQIALFGEVWEARHALRLLIERKPEVSELKTAVKSVPKFQKDANGEYPMEHLRALARAADSICVLSPDGSEEPSEPLRTLSPNTRHNLITSVSQRVKDREQWLGSFQEFANAPTSPRVRLALASACQRLTVEQRKPIVLALLAHGEDADDANLPLMDWYAAEPIVAADPAWAAEALAACKIPKVAEFIARRMSEK